MNAITAFLDSLPKTYLAAAGFLVIAAIQAFVFHDMVGAGQSLSAALGAVGLRRAITTETAKAVATNTAMTTAAANAVVAAIPEGLVVQKAGVPTPGTIYTSSKPFP